ncbi:MAG: winged helix-turn-helix domain-containing protein [Vicinamibacterales bacterium]
MAGVVYCFGPLELDPSSRALTNAESPVALTARQFDLLHLLVARAGQVLSKDALIEAAWSGVAVTDNSVEQAISTLRRVLRECGVPAAIETQARRGYRFSVDVRRAERRAPDASLEALLAPHRAWIEGRAALETLERSQVMHARDVFQRVLALVPDQAPAHVGLANAGLMQFEMTRAERTPDVEALELAARHARDACRIDPRYGEAWATLGFVLDRTGHHADALAASRMAVSLEADNWRHHVRLAYVSWGEERLRAARRALSLLPGFPLAHWLAATVHVARGAMDDAERELRDGIAAQSLPASARFSSVALHWLLGLVLLARGDARAALDEFQLELASEASGQLYARECCANTWYAVGAVRIGAGDFAGALAAFTETLARVPLHPAANAALRVLYNGAHEQVPATNQADSANPSRTSTGQDVPARANETDLALAHAVALALQKKHTLAAETITLALSHAPEGSALWLLPVEPLLHTSANECWTAALALLRSRAA